LSAMSFAPEAVCVFAHHYGPLYGEEEAWLPGMRQRWHNVNHDKRRACGVARDIGCYTAWEVHRIAIEEKLGSSLTRGLYCNQALDRGLIGREADVGVRHFLPYKSSSSLKESWRCYV
jgi:hypothetical protein